MPPTNLAQYYTGNNMALPSVSDRANAYSGYGLGGGYTGSSSQNQALLGKLMAGTPGTPTGTTTPTSGGYTQTPTGNPQPTTNDPGINDVVDLAHQQAGALQNYNAGLAGTIAHAYQDAAGSVASGGTGLTDTAAAMNKIQDALNGSRNASAAVVPQTVAAAGGSFANNDQVTTQEGTSNIPYAEQVAQLSANLVPAENAYSSAQNATTARVQQVNNAAALEAAGFSQGQQLELQALQAKVARGQALTDEEFQRETQLRSTQTAANAAIQSATITANATKYNTSLGNPGISSTLDANGNPVGSSYLNTPLPASNPTASSAISNILNNTFGGSLSVKSAP